jgi:hypothetical protein
VGLSTTTEGASIYYTIGGDNPTTNSTPYSGPINIEINSVLRAIAVKEGLEDSEIMTEAYTITAVQSYIKDIYYGNGNSRQLAETRLRSKTTEDLTPILKDFNHEAGGDWIFLGYTITSNPNEAIRGLVANNTKSPANTMNWNGISYQKYNLDLNNGAGGDYIWLYYTKEADAGPPLRSLFVQLNRDTITSMTGEGWSRVEFMSGNTPNFNRGTKGAPIYLWMQRY